MILRTQQDMVVNFAPDSEMVVNEDKTALKIRIRGKRNGCPMRPLQGKGC